MKTQKTTTKTDNRTIQQVEKSVITMRRRIGAIRRSHAKLQVRIATLEEQGRIISLSHDSDIVVGIQGWYVKSESLNPDPDSICNWYYEVTWNEEAGYDCPCERLNGTCQHITKLAATFAPTEKQEVQTRKQRQPVFASTMLEPEADEDLQAYKQRYEASYQRELVAAGTLNNSNAGFSLYR